MKNIVKILVVIVAAATLATVSNYFFTGFYNIIPWSVAALIIGFAADSRRDIIITGAVFGYVLFVVYIWLGYNGKTDTGSMEKFALFDAAFSLVGGGCGIVGAFIGRWMKIKVKQMKYSD